MILSLAWLTVSPATSQEQEDSLVLIRGNVTFAALMEVKTEADLSEEQQPHPVHDLQESPGMIKVQVKADIAEEPPKHHPVHDSQVKSPHLVEMSQVKIEVDIAEEPPVPWMTASLIHSKCCELALFYFVELVHFRYVHLFCFLFLPLGIF